MAIGSSFRPTTTGRTTGNLSTLNEDGFVLSSRGHGPARLKVEIHTTTSKHDDVMIKSEHKQLDEDQDIIARAV